MKNLFKLLGVIALIAVIGFSFAACDDENSDSDGNGNGNDTWGNPPTALVGTWLMNGASPVLVINADGTGSNAGDPVTSWKVKGSELKMTYQGIESVVKWSVSGNQLTLSYPDDTSLLGMGSLLIAYCANSPLTKQSGSGTGGGLSALVGDWQSNGTQVFQVTSAGKFIMNGTTYDISVSGNTATLKFGSTTVGTFDYAINNNQMVIISGTGIGTTIALLSPVGKSSGNNVNEKPGDPVDPVKPGDPDVYIVTGVTLNQSYLTLALGATATLTATVQPSNASNKNVMWTNSNSNVVTITTAGNNITVTAITVGSATITVTTVDGSRTATCSVVVSDSGGSNNNSSVLNYIGEGPAPNYQKYRLTITDNNSFELQVGSKISSGTAAQNGSQFQWTLSPQAGGPFTVQLSTSGIVLISGIITFNDGSYETGPGTLTPTHSGSGVFVTLNKLNNVNLDGNDVEGGSSGGISWVVTTTELILEFNRAIPGLSASDISLSGVSGVNKGALSGSNPYTLPISGFTSSGTLNMAISKSGYDINGSPWSVYINYVYYPVVDMVQIPGGSFEMRSDDGYNERPKHTVTLSGFSMGRYEVTQEQWTAVMGRNPSSFQSSPASAEVQNKRPVESISWYAALVFCNRLSILGGLSPAYRISGSTDPAVWGTNINSSWDAVEIVAGSNGYRLPTEAQWEYAARGGNGSPGNYAYSGSDYADNVAWYNSNSGNKTHEAGKKAPNGLGLYDMSGNVWEWCWDWYDGDYYSNSPSNNPTGPTYGNNRVYRGGSWNSAAYDDWDLPTRRYYEPRNSNSSIGLRVVLP